jgi:hypothetical protein
VKPFTTTRAHRRTPVGRDRYRAVARNSGVAPKLQLQRPPLAFTAAALALALVFVGQTAPRIASVLDTGITDFGGKLAEIFPQLEGSKPIELPSGGGTVSAEISALLPDFTRDPQVKVAGRIPGFAQAEGRMIEVTVNGALLSSLAPDQAGAFAANVDLRDGPNAIAVALVSGKDVVAHSSYTVVLDRQPPTLALSAPAANARVEGPTITVTGTSEPGASITIDGRTVFTAQDGSFTDRFPATPGALTITIVAKDRAGNETTVKTPIVVVAPTQAVPLSVLVVLDNARVKPGQIVTAQILVTANGQPRANEQVTLSVGVVTIGSARTNSVGMATLGFAAPPNEGEAFVVVLASGGASGRASLTVAR